MTEVKAHYDRKYASEADSSDRRVLVPTARPRDRFEACVSFLPSRFQGGDILELGAGSGIVARSLLAAGLPCDTYTLTEFSTSRIEGLRRSFSDPRVRVEMLDADHLPEQPDATYDVIVMIALVEHLLDPIRALQRVRQMLRPGGFLYLDTPNIAKVSRRLKLLPGRFPATASQDEGLTTYGGQPADLFDEGHLHYFTYRAMNRLLVDRCGFEPVERLGYHVGPSHLGRLVDDALARWWPELFSELVLIARTR